MGWPSSGVYALLRDTCAEPEAPAEADTFVDTSCVPGSDAADSVGKTTSSAGNFTAQVFERVAPAGSVPTTLASTVGSMDSVGRDRHPLAEEGTDGTGCRRSLCPSPIAEAPPSLGLSTVDSVDSAMDGTGCSGVVVWCSGVPRATALASVGTVGMLGTGCSRAASSAVASNGGGVLACAESDCSPCALAGCGTGLSTAVPAALAG
mmetsp:Transcript_64804/g.163190  ORF Transcript_64804/g.163190 Transcript_64804/m.163190 type:complete len:206 (+) Transcript_64804:363-980(+)